MLSPLRHVTVLTLVRVRTEQKGLYTVLVTNGDDTKEVTFDLEVQGERIQRPFLAPNLQSWS